jgi:hypothetical protein
MTRCVVIAIGFALLIGFPLVADEQQKKTSESTNSTATNEKAGEQPVLGSAASGTSNSLASAASKIKLQQPSSNGAVVITNETLKKTQGKGAVSTGGGTTVTTETQPAGPAATASQPVPGAGNPLNALVEQYHQQLAVVQNLETRLKNFDKQLANPARDPHYPYLTHRPQDRPGGVQDPAQGQRELLAKDLEGERKKLDAIKDQARRAGLKL